MLDENAVIKDWRDIDLTFGLIYPNIYKIGMSSYSIRLLYYLINSQENYVCERFFLPENIKYPASKDLNPINVIRSRENKIHPMEFDILGFSFQFENDFKNILWFLDKAEIPLRYEDRRIAEKNNGKKYPLIICGGTVPTSNPISINQIFDAIFIGDSEPNIDPFLKIFLEYKFKNIDFHDFFQNAKNIKGIYLPSINNKVERTILEDLNASPTPNFQLISKNSSKKPIFEDKFFIEINRGCPYKCKFCISSYHNFPYRNKNYEKIIEAIDTGIKFNDFDTICLIGPCVSSHPKFIEICDYIIKKGKTLKIPSIRIEHIDEKLIQILEKAGIKTITIAPETGSETLRYDLGKKISNEKIYSILNKIKLSQIKNIKFYFLIGLPNENENTINESIDFLKDIDRLGFYKDSLRVNINPLVPKLNTPYEKNVDFYFTDNSKLFLLKYQRFIQELKKISSFKLKFSNPKEIINNAKLQTLISLGDNLINQILIHFYLYGANFGSLRRSKKEFSFSMDDYLLRIKESYSPWKF